MKRWTWLMQSVAMVALNSCASPDPRFYTLQMVEGGAVSASPSVIEVRRPGLAGYLDRSDIVLRDAEYRLDVNSQLRWAEPLGDMIGRVLAQDLSQRLSGSSVFSELGAISADADLRVEIDVDRFDEGADGQMVLVVEVAVERGRTHHPVVTRHLVLHATPAGAGAGALVAAMSELLGQLADRVAEDVRRGTAMPLSE